MKAMIFKIIAAILTLGAVFMGLKQGYAMLTGSAEMVEMFSKWGFTETTLAINGAVTILAAVLLLFPRTFVLGNILMALGILMIIAFHIKDGDWKGVGIEMPFLLLNLVLIYLRYPFSDLFKSPK